MVSADIEIPARGTPGKQALMGVSNLLERELARWELSVRFDPVRQRSTFAPDRPVDCANGEAPHWSSSHRHTTYPSDPWDVMS